jgi:threonine 3-dehydrogenase
MNENTRREISLSLPSGADVILEMSGSEQALNDGLKTVRPGGRVTLLGLPNDKVKIDLSNDVILKGLILQGIFGRKIFATWELASTLLNKRAVDLEKIITHRLKIHEYERAFKLMLEGKCGKIVMKF